jgi:hypothetical protein
LILSPTDSSNEITGKKVGCLYHNYVGLCPLAEAYRIYTTMFQDLALLPSSSDQLPLHLKKKRKKKRRICQ